MSTESTSSSQGSRPARPRKGLDGRTIGARYRVERTVAAGANTLIADAHDTELDRPVTLKLIRPELAQSEEFRRRFRRLMESMASLSHPNVQAVYDCGEERIGKRDTVYVVSEQLSGGSLRDLFDRGRSLSPSQALLVGLEACRGLDFAHRRGLVHSELTPSKLVFGDDRRLRIVDFGLARFLGEAAWEDPSQVPTHVARYASPEQARIGHGVSTDDIDGKTDVYALALILTEAVTGTVPFRGDSTVSTLANRIDKLMPVSADLGPLASILERAGRPEAAERASASQLGRALVQAASKLARPTPIPMLSGDLFTSETELRRPDDPTGGVARPADETGPVLVPPAATVRSDTGPGSGDRAARVSNRAERPEATDAASPESARGEGRRRSKRRREPAVEQHAAAGRRTPGSVAGDPLAARGGGAATTTPSEAPGRRGRRGVARRGASSPVADTANGIVDDAAVDADAVDAPTTADVELATNERRTGGTAHDPLTEEGRDESALAGAADDSETGGEATATDLADVAPATDDDSSADGRGSAASAAAPAFAGIAAARAKQTKPEEPAKPATRGRRAEPAAVATPPSTVNTAPAGPRRWVGTLFGIVLVAALAVLGLIAWQLFSTTTHAVPELAGMTETEALAAVEDSGWDVRIDTTRDDTYDTPGEVVRSLPSAGHDLAEGSPLVIYLSSGPELRHVPDLTGMPLTEASAALDELRLAVGTESLEYHEDVPAGTVISSSVGVDLIDGGVLPDTRVDVVVSQGPRPRQVPDLRGRDADEAARLVEPYGLQIEVGDGVADDTVPDGQIAAQSPAPMEAIERGETIVVQLSTGPDLVVVPDLGGMSVAEAGEALSAAGLELGAVLGSPAGRFQHASVDGAVVEPGATHVPRGSTVDIVALA